MYATLIAKIKETLEKVDNVNLIYSVPKTTNSAFPAVYFQPDGMTNEFESGDENAKVYKFMMLVIVGTSGTTVEEVFTNVLPNTVDAIIAQFDADWNMGTIGGHRAWTVIDTADPWAYDEEQEGPLAYAPLSLKIRLVTTN